jgi:hypothetical protein
LPPPSPKQVHAFCDHVELLIRARVYDAQTFTLLTDPQSIMVIGLRFMTSKVIERVPVPDWKVGWEVSSGSDNPLVVQFVQVDAEDHHGRPGQHRTDPQAVL